MAQEIFVLGNNRSGTKWISNILLNHPQICGVQSDYHCGILETNLFNNFPRKFGDLHDNDSFVAFVETFAATDFFRLTGLEKSFLYKLQERDYYRIFSRVMDEFTHISGKKRWLQKSHIFYYEALKEHFKKAKFIFIKRKIGDNIRSVYTIQKRLNKSPNMLNDVAVYILSEKLIKKYCGSKNVYVIEYEKLRESTVDTVKGIFDFLCLDFSGEMLKINYLKNTSYRREEDKGVFPANRIYQVHFLRILLTLIPGWFFRKIYRRRTRNNVEFITGTFSIQCAELGLEPIEY